MSLSDSGSAVLDAPISDNAPVVSEAAPNTDKPSGEATPASERNGRHEKPADSGRKRQATDLGTKGAKAEKSATAETKRDETGRFASDKPKPEAPAAPEFPEELLARGEKAGLTRHASRKHGDPAKLTLEIERRERAAAAKTTEPEPAPRAQAEPNKPVTTTAAAKAEEDRLAKLGDLGDEYGELSARDKAYREELTQLRDELREMRSLRDEVHGLKSRAQQDGEEREVAVRRKEASELDAFVAEVGDEFAPMLGRGSMEHVAGTPYMESRSEIYAIAKALEPFHSEKSFKQICRLAAAARYPDEFQQLTERELLKRAQDAAKTRGAPASTVTVTTPSGYSGPSKGDPEIQAKVREIKLRRQGLA